MSSNFGVLIEYRDDSSKGHSQTPVNFMADPSMIGHVRKGAQYNIVEMRRSDREETAKPGRRLPRLETRIFAIWGIR